MAKRKDTHVTVVMEEMSEMENPFVEVREVERPTGTKQQWHVDPAVERILGTVETGKAILLAARTAESMRKLQNALRNKVKSKGWKMSYRKAGEGRIVAWVEKIRESK